MRRPDWPSTASVGMTNISEIVRVDVYGDFADGYGLLFTEVYDTRGNYMGRIQPPTKED